MLRIYSVERRQKWGEKRKEGRIGDDEISEGWWNTGKNTMNIKVKTKLVTKVLSITTSAFFFYKSPFKDYGEEE